MSNEIDRKSPLVRIGDPIPWCHDDEGEMGVMAYIPGHAEDNPAHAGYSPSFPGGCWITTARGTIKGASEEDSLLANFDLAQLDTLIGKLATARKLIVDAGKAAPPEAHEAHRGGYRFHEFRRPWRAPDGVAELAAMLVDWQNAPEVDPRAAFEAATFACGCGWRGLGVDVGTCRDGHACPRCLNRDGNQPAPIGEG